MKIFFFPKKESSGGKKAGDELCNHMILWFHSTEGSSDNKNANTSKKIAEERNNESYRKVQHGSPSQADVPSSTELVI